MIIVRQSADGTDPTKTIQSMRAFLEEVVERRTIDLVDVSLGGEPLEWQYTDTTRSRGPTVRSRIDPSAANRATNDSRANREFSFNEMRPFRQGNVAYLLKETPSKWSNVSAGAE